MPKQAIFFPKMLSRQKTLFSSSTGTVFDSGWFCSLYIPHLLSTGQSCSKSYPKSIQFSPCPLWHLDLAAITSYPDPQQPPNWRPPYAFSCPRTHSVLHSTSRVIFWKQEQNHVASWLHPFSYLPTVPIIRFKLVSWLTNRRILDPACLQPPSPSATLLPSIHSSFSPRSMPASSLWQRFYTKLSPRLGMVLPWSLNVWCQSYHRLSTLLSFPGRVLSLQTHASVFYTRLPYLIFLYIYFLFLPLSPTGT